MKEYEIYLKSLEEKSEHTIRYYSNSIEKFINHFGIKSVSDIEKLQVSDYLDFYSSLNLKPDSVNAVIRALSAFFSFLELNEYISVNNAFRRVRFGKSKFKKVPSIVKEYPTEDEIVQMIKACRTTQEKFMLTLMGFTGIRRNEVSNIKLSDIKDCSIVINRKGGSQQVIQMHNTVCQMLSIYMAERESNSPYLFYAERGEKGGNQMLTGTAINNRVKRAAELAGFSPERVASITAHGLRHMVATRIIKEFGENAAIAVLGHKSKSTIKRYNHSGDFVSNQALVNQTGLNLKVEEL